MARRLLIALALLFLACVTLAALAVLALPSAG